MDSKRGIKALLLGIEVTIVGGVLGLAAATATPSPPSSLIGLIVAFVGLLIAASGMRSEKAA